MRTSILLMTAIITILFLSSCSTNKFIALSDNSDCVTTLEGRFLTKDEYNYYAPILLFEKKYKMGKVIKFDDAGVFFVEKKSGILHSPDTLSFKYNEIRAVVDSNKQCIWGELKSREKQKVELRLYATRKDDPEYSPIYIDMVSETDFSYCVKPGVYVISGIYREEKPSSLDKAYVSIRQPLFEFVVEKGKTNYLGDITLVADNKKTQNTLSVAFKEQGSASPLIGGLFGGLAYGVTNALLNATADSCGSFNLDIIHDKEYESKSGKPVVNTHLHELRDSGTKIK